MYPLLLSYVKETLIFSTDFRKRAKIPSFIKICPVAATFFHADGQTDWETGMTKLIAVFRTFANAPKNSLNK